MTYEAGSVKLSYCAGNGRRNAVAALPLKGHGDELLTKLSGGQGVGIQRASIGTHAHSARADAANTNRHNPVTVERDSSQPRVARRDAV